MARLGCLRVQAPLFLEPPRYEEPQPQPHQRDQDHPADELGECEVPADEDPDHDPELEDKIRRGELERHRRGEARPLREERLRDRDSGIATGRRRRAEAGRERDLSRSTSPEGPLDPGARDPCLNDPRQCEAEHERPRNLPGHLEGVPEPVADRREHAHARGYSRRGLSYSTVTVFARLRGWSTLSPRRRAIRYASSCNGMTARTACR